MFPIHGCPPSFRFLPPNRSYSSSRICCIDVLYLGTLDRTCIDGQVRSSASVATLKVKMSTKQLPVHVILRILRKRKERPPKLNRNTVQVDNYGVRKMRPALRLNDKKCEENEIKTNKGPITKERQRNHFSS